MAYNLSLQSQLTVFYRAGSICSRSVFNYRLCRALSIYFICSHLCMLHCLFDEVDIVDRLSSVFCCCTSVCTDLLCFVDLRLTFNFHIFTILQQLKWPYYDCWTVIEYCLLNLFMNSLQCNWCVVWRRIQILATEMLFWFKKTSTTFIFWTVYNARPL